MEKPDDVSHADNVNNTQGKPCLKVPGTVHGGGHFIGRQSSRKQEHVIYSYGWILSTPLSFLLFFPRAELNFIPNSLREA